MPKTEIIRKRKQYNDVEAFELHQKGWSDERIATKMGLSVKTIANAISREKSRRKISSKVYVVTTDLSQKNVVGTTALSIYLETIHKRGEKVMDIERVSA